MSNAYREGKSSQQYTTLEQISRDPDFMRDEEMSDQLDMLAPLENLPEKLRNEVRMLLDLVQAARLLERPACGVRNAPRLIVDDLKFLNPEFEKQIRTLKSYLFDREKRHKHVLIYIFFTFLATYLTSSLIAMNTYAQYDIDAIRALFYRLFPVFAVLYSLPLSLPMTLDAIKRQKKFGGLSKKHEDAELQKVVTESDINEFSIESQEIAIKILGNQREPINSSIATKKMNEAIRIVFEKYLEAQTKKWQGRTAEFTLSLPLRDRHGDLTALIQGDTRQLLKDSEIEFDVPTYYGMTNKLRVKVETETEMDIEAELEEEIEHSKLEQIMHS